MFVILKTDLTLAYFGNNVALPEKLMSTAL
jgi:hypothetical protein